MLKTHGYLFEATEKLKARYVSPKKTTGIVASYGNMLAAAWLLHDRVSGSVGEWDETQKTMPQKMAIRNAVDAINNIAKDIEMVADEGSEKKEDILDYARKTYAKLTKIG